MEVLRELNRSVNKTSYATVFRCSSDIYYQRDGGNRIRQYFKLTGLFVTARV
jgi:hypothetical protein